MANKYRITKGDKTVVESQNPVTLTGVGANKTVVDGEYKYCVINDEGEVVSQVADVEGWKTLSITVAGITLDKTTATIDVGASTKLTATVAPSNATNKAVTFSSADTTIATVDNAGTVKGVKAGTVKVTVKTTDGNKTAECTVTVKTPVVAVTGVSLDKTAQSLEEGSTATLKATVAPSNATDKGVTWKSSDTAIATVDSNGKVTAVKAGTATITVTTKSASKTATCAVTVTTPPEPEPEPEG